MTDAHVGSADHSSDAEAKRKIIHKSPKKTDAQLTDEIIQRMKLVELRAEANKLQVSAKGTKDALRKRLLAHVEERRTRRNGARKGDEETDEESDEETEEDTNGETDGESEEEYERTKNVSPSPFSIRDVEGSIPEFSGDDLVPVKGWLSKFEDMAELLRWNDLQKLIYGKRVLRGSAKRFMESERGITSWTAFRKRLMGEFKSTTSSATIHAQLASRKKRSEETGRQYVYIMQEIAALGKVEERALIEHVINGVVDDEVNKTILYQSRTLKELKRNIEIYDVMKEKSRIARRSNRNDDEDKRERRTDSSKARKARCFSCGSPDHGVKECPMAGEGPKCFRCNEFGHISKACQKRVNLVVASEDLKAITIQGKVFKALVDSGSDLTLLREDKYREIGAGALTQTVTRAKGAGNGNIRLVGMFESEVSVDDVTCPLKIHIVPTDAIPYECILGKNFLSNVEVTIRKGKVMKMRPINEEDVRSTNEEDAGTASIEGEWWKGVFNITVHELDVKPQFAREVERIVKDSKPAKQVITPIETQIRLHDDLPVVSRPCRLAPREKEVLNKSKERDLSREDSIDDRSRDRKGNRKREIIEGESRKRNTKKGIEEDIKKVKRSRKDSSSAEEDSKGRKNKTDDDKSRSRKSKNDSSSDDEPAKSRKRRNSSSEDGKSRTRKTRKDSTSDDETKPKSKESGRDTSTDEKDIVGKDIKKKRKVEDSANEEKVQKKRKKKTKTSTSESAESEVEEKKEKKDKRHKKHNRRCKQATRYKEGNVVFIKRTQFGPTIKIAAEYLGPYKVTRVIGNKRYEVRHGGKGEGPRVTTTAADYMKLYRPEEEETQSSGTEDPQNGRM